MLTTRMRRPRASWALTYMTLALAAAVTLTSVAAAGPAATKQRVAINVEGARTFALTPFRRGAVKRDSGRVSGNWRNVSGRDVQRNGQRIAIYHVLWKLEGARGTITVRERSEWFEMKSDLNDDGIDDDLALGTWKVVRGTGQYAGITGGGGSGHVGLGSLWHARYEGFLTAP